MNVILMKILRAIAEVPPVFNVARKIVDLGRNENNCDAATNGELAFVSRNASKFSIVFDVGANVGEWSRDVAAACPHARILSFEPVGKTFDLLSKNAAKGLELHNIAFGAADGTIDIYVSPSDSTLNSLYVRESVGVVVPQSVRVRTIDGFCAERGIERISLLKIDTEGHELNVLQGASRMIAIGAIDVVQFEYGGTYINAGVLLKDIFEFFAERDYEIAKIFSDRIEPVPEYSQDLENFQYSNYVAVRRNCGCR